MMTTTLQQIICERVSFLKEQINQDNKSEVNNNFRVPVHAITSAADDIEKIEIMILQRKSLLKNSKDVYEADRLFAEQESLEWLQCQIARFS